jgi:phosphopantothenoylcysteine decarboxylase / phosphopantothenate---cysteine ligase
MRMLKGKKILIGITGSIAAYKIPLLIRLLKKEGAEVRIVMTPAAKDFVTPLTLATLSENPVEGGFFDQETGAWHSHVELGLWADLFLIAPASANTLAKMHMGIADNYLLTVYLSARCAVMFAPAMDYDMYQHPATKNNIEGLSNRGHLLIAPAYGELASGLCGEGRLEEPEVIFDLIKTFFSKKKRFTGKKVMVSAGPTHEAIDPVRFIGNHSSGLMGISIADAFAAEGAEVKLILGPTHLQPSNKNVEVIAVTSADEMYKNCRSLFEVSDITVMTAAVADYKPADVAKQKIKKQTASLTLQLSPTPDILLKLGQLKKKNQILVGFALETNEGKKHALEKLHKKNLDLIVLNSLEEQGAGFRHATNKVSFFAKNEEEVHFELKQKTAVAADLVNHIYSMLTTENS